MAFVRQILFVILALSQCGVIAANDDVNFDEWFDNKTLRVDYIFAGDSARNFRLTNCCVCKHGRDAGIILIV